MNSETKEKHQTRPNASPGFWLCTLIPMAYLVGGFKYPQSSNTFLYRITFMTALGLNLQSALYFLQLNTTNPSRKLLVICAVIPSIVTSNLFLFGLRQSLLVSTFWGFLLPLFYQFVYIKIFKLLPWSFTYGEASIIVQGFVLFILNSFLQIPFYFKEHPTTINAEINAIMMTGIFSLVIACCLLYAVPMLRKVYLFYTLMVILVWTICIIPITDQPPIVTLTGFILGDLRRIFLLIFYFGLVGLTISTVSWQLNKSGKASTTVRKIFHILVVCVFIPGLIYQCTLMYIATGVALAFLIVLEVLRLLKIPPFAETLNSSTQVFVDEKDPGKIAVTPYYLLIGCSVPMWISPIPCTIADTAIGENLIPMLSGVLSIGIGDSAASVIGSKIGKHKIPGSQKSIEGLISAVLTQIFAVYILYWLEIVKFNSTQAAITSLAILISSILEAYTDQVDNLVIPLVFFIISSLA